MDEGIAKMNEAWTDAEDDAGQTPTSRYRQSPASPRVPLWFGGSSPAARRRAATVGEGWAPLFLTPEDYGPALQALRRETVEAGRDPDAVEPAVVIFARVGSDDAAARGLEWLSHMYALPPKAFERHLVAGEPEACAAAVDRYVEAGARHVIVMVAAAGAVQHFALLRSAFMDRAHAVPAGVSA
jgi:alkanesulfonate monooxygenase SsuD/methylene tetrahydromethanopterin reductase-like flavin-dependent oxidoreductase (luciferase family)